MPFFDKNALMLLLFQFKAHFYYFSLKISSGTKQRESNMFRPFSSLYGSQTMLFCLLAFAYTILSAWNCFLGSHFRRTQEFSFKTQLRNLTSRLVSPPPHRPSGRIRYFHPWCSLRDPLWIFYHAALISCLHSNLILHYLWLSLKHSSYFSPFVTKSLAHNRHVMN